MRQEFYKRFDNVGTHERYEYCGICGVITNEKDLVLMNQDYSAMEWGCPECVAEIIPPVVKVEVAIHGI